MANQLSDCLIIWMRWMHPSSLATIAYVSLMKPLRDPGCLIDFLVSLDYSPDNPHLVDCLNADWCHCCNYVIDQWSYLSLIKTSRQHLPEPGCPPLSGWGLSPSWSYKSKSSSIVIFIIIKVFIMIGWNSWKLVVLKYVFQKSFWTLAVLFISAF